MFWRVLWFTDRAIMARNERARVARAVSYWQRGMTMYARMILTTRNPDVYRTASGLYEVARSYAYSAYEPCELASGVYAIDEV